MAVKVLARDLFVAMLSGFLGVRGLTCSFRIEGLGETFIVGKNKQATSCTIVFDGLMSFCIFAVSPCLMTFAKLYIDGHVEGKGVLPDAA